MQAPDIAVVRTCEDRAEGVETFVLRHAARDTGGSIDVEESVHYVSMSMPASRHRTSPASATVRALCSTVLDLEGEARTSSGKGFRLDLEVSAIGRIGDFFHNGGQCLSIELGACEDHRSFPSELSEK